MPDWFVFSYSSQTFLDFCPFQGPTEALVEAVLSSFVVLFPGSSNLSEGCLSLFRHCSRYRYLSFCDIGSSDKSAADSDQQ